MNWYKFSQRMVNIQEVLQQRKNAPQQDAPQRMVNVQEILQQKNSTPQQNVPQQNVPQQNVPQQSFKAGDGVIFIDPKTNQTFVGAYMGPYQQNNRFSLITIGDTVGKPRIIETSTLQIHDLSNLKPGDKVSLIKYPESENPATVVRVISPKQIEVITGTQRRMSPFAYSVLPL